MKPREVTQEDVDFWSQGPIKFEIGPMMGVHLGAEDIPSVLKGRGVDGRLIVKVAWVLDERDDPNQKHTFHELTVWTTFRGGMPPSDVVIV